jgi:hypothetical protein
VFLNMLRLLMFTLPDIDGDDFVRNFLLHKNHFDRAGASRERMTVNLQDHCSKFVWWIVGQLVELSKMSIHRGIYMAARSYKYAHRNVFLVIKLSVCQLSVKV